MIKSVSEFMRDVRVMLDQDVESTALLSEYDTDALHLDDIIRSKLVDAVREVHMNAPVELLDLGHRLEDDVYWLDQGSGRILLPGDFMRLVAFKMSDWERAVNVPISAQSAEYALQRQRVKALRGTCQRPVVAIVVHSGRLALEFYSCKDEEAEMELGLYIPEPRIDENDGIDVSERCYRDAVLLAGRGVLETLSGLRSASQEE